MQKFGSRAEKPAVVMLKQTIAGSGFLWELAEGLADRVGPVIVYSDSPAPIRVPNITAIIGPRYRRESYLSRITSWLRFLAGAAILSIRIHRGALLFIIAQPPLLPLLGLFRHALWRQKYIVWVDDIYPDVLVRSGLLSRGSPFLSVLEWGTSVTLKRAAVVYTLAPRMAETLKKYIRGRTSKLIVVPTWVDTDRFRPVAKEENPLARLYGQLNKITVQYSGNFGLTHDLDGVIQAAGQLEKNTRLRFMLIGAGSSWTAVREVASRLGNISVLPWQEPETFKWLLSMADISIVTQKKSIEGVSLPSKTFYAMAVGSAILGISRTPSDLADIIARHRCGINVEPDDVEGLVRALDTMQDASVLEEYRRNSRRAAETEFSRKINLPKVLESVQKVFSGA
jgi:glycosyltransferase involved in cell wall biosynthesis